jgi:hypothetical protein
MQVWLFEESTLPVLGNRYHVPLFPYFSNARHLHPTNEDLREQGIGNRD